MSRAAIYDAALADSRLVALGLDEDSLLVNYDGEQRPVDRMFIVMGWGTDEIAMKGDDDLFIRRYKTVTFWVHLYREDTTDFSRLDRILDILDDIYLNMVHVQGTDGYTVTTVESAGRSRDMRDDAYQTICRSVSYRILSRETASV